MSQLRIVIGALAVIGLLLVVPILGLLALAVFVIAGIGMWVAEGSKRAPTSRPCPVCGEAVPNGLTQCESCGHDFRAAAAASEPLRD